MTRIASTFRRLSKTGEIAAIPYLPVGCPDIQTSRSLLPVIGRQGADLIALGTFLALPDLNDALGFQETGASLNDCLSIAAEARRTNEVPLVLAPSFALAQVYGFGSLASACASAGIDGLLLPDLLVRDFADMAHLCAEAGVDLIPALSTSTLDVVGDLLSSAGGFVYCPLRFESKPVVDQLCARLRAATDLPLVIGTAADWPDTISAEIALADGILARSGLSDLLVSYPDDEIMLEVSDYVRALKDATSRNV